MPYTSHNNTNHPITDANANTDNNTGNIVTNDN